MIRSLTGGPTTAAYRHLDVADFEEVGLRVAERRFGRKDVIFAPGDPDDQLYFLFEGTVRLYKIYGGYKEATVAGFQEGGVFGGARPGEGGGGSIFAPGDPDDQLYFLFEGTVRLYKIYGGYKEATVAVLQDGGVFGGLSLEEGGWQSIFAEAVTEARVARVRKSVLNEAVRRSPDFATKLFFSFSDRESTRLNSSHANISYAVFCLKKKKQ